MGLIKKNPVDDYSSKSEAYRYREQCYLNEEIQELYILPKKYNWSPDWHAFKRPSVYHAHEMHVSKPVAIVHFNGVYKPWNSDLSELGKVTEQFRAKEYYNKACLPVWDYLEDPFKEFVYLNSKL